MSETPLNSSVLTPVEIFTQTRVLLVDDQRIVAESIRRMINKEPDFHFTYCADPTEALDVAAREKITVILLDLVMPDMDGMTLMQFFRTDPNTKDIPIIVMSSKEDPLIKRDAFAHGANDYVVKLPDEIELIARLRAHSRQYCMRLERDAAFIALRALQTRLEQSNSELQRLSSLDGLTGIANRRIFDERLENEWQRGIRDHEPITLMMIDIDYFKAYNDCYGHQGGDQTLQKVAHALRSTAMRPADLVARYGGEEFGIILPNTAFHGAESLAERLLTNIRALQIPHSGSKAAAIVTVTVGALTQIPSAQTPPSLMIQLADKALYTAKNLGRNRFHCLKS